MINDYVTVQTEELTIFGHKVKAITERFNDNYLNSIRFQPRCLRCCFKDSKFCNFIKCTWWSNDLQTHFEIIK